MSEERDKREGLRTGGANIGTGRRKIVAVTGGRSVDPGLATPWEHGKDSGDTGVKMVEKYVGGELVKVPASSSRETPVVVEDAAIGEFLKNPVPASVIEEKYGLRRGYLGVALRRRYGDVSTLKRALQGSLLEAGLVMVEHAMLNVEEMTPAQAMLGAKIATDAAVQIEKSIREAPRTIDFGQLGELGEGLARIQAFITGSEEGLGHMEITSEDDIVTRS